MTKQKSNSINLNNIPNWAKDVVWYQIFPERFCNGDKSNDPKLKDINEGNIKGWAIKDWNSDWYEMDKWEKENFGTVFKSVFSRRYGGDLQGIINKLDYLQDLGITAIYLNPIFQSPSLHKYDGTSFHHIEETFGPDPDGDRKLIKNANETENPSTWVWTKADKLFLKLIKEVHKRGIKIIIDGVFNHSGRLFFAFQDILKNKKKSRYADWYEVSKWDKKNQDGFEYKGWFGHKYLPEFKRNKNNVNESYKKYLFNITKRWMSPNGKTANGIDGWRLDVAYCLPHGFWKEWRKCVKKINPESYINGEVVFIDPSFLQGDEFDALMNYPFLYTVSEFFIDKKNKISVNKFDKRLKDLREAYPEEITFVMQNLLSSHDSSRLATLIVNPDMNIRNYSNHFNNSKIENNFGYKIDRGTKKNLAVHKLIVIFQMTYLGAPMIYYGDEVRMVGANDPDCRKPMLWEEIDYNDEVKHPVKGHKRKREKNVVNKELLEHYKKIIKIRNENIALCRGNFKTIYKDNKKDIFGFMRKYKNEIILVILNNSLKPQKIKINSPLKKINNFKDILNNDKKYKVKNGKINLTIKPKWGIILKDL